MRVSDAYRLDALGRVRQVLEIFALREVAALVQAAVDEYPRPARFQKIIRAGHAARSAMEGQFHNKDYTLKPGRILYGSTGRVYKDIRKERFHEPDRIGPVPPPARNRSFQDRKSTPLNSSHSS